MSGSLRNRLRRLEERNGPPSAMIVILPASLTEAERAAKVAAAREVVGEHGTVITMIDDPRWHQPPGPPTRRRPRPGEVDPYDGRAH